MNPEYVGIIREGCVQSYVPSHVIWETVPWSTQIASKSPTSLATFIHKQGSIYSNDASTFNGKSRISSYLWHREALSSTSRRRASFLSTRFQDTTSSRLQRRSPILTVHPYHLKIGWTHIRVRKIPRMRNSTLPVVTSSSSLVREDYMYDLFAIVITPIEMALSP